MRLLLLGGTTEASALARRLADDPRVAATLSLAGRTTNPAASPLPTRSGGFGGVEGMARYLKAERIAAVVDATHPFAAQMSQNALAACQQTNIPLAVFTRPPWRPEPGDNWIEVADVQQAAAALGETPKRVFLTVGRQQVAPFHDLPHKYLLRSIDPPGALPNNAELILAKGPFTVADEIALMRGHRIDIVVSKNAGGAATQAKIEAARALGLPVVMIQRPPLGSQTVFHDIESALAWIAARAN